MPGVLGLRCNLNRGRAHGGNVEHGVIASGGAGVGLTERMRVVLYLSSLQLSRPPCGAQGT